MAKETKEPTEAVVPQGHRFNVGGECCIDRAEALCSMTKLFFECASAAQDAVVDSDFSAASSRLRNDNIFRKGDAERINGDDEDKEGESHPQVRSWQEERPDQDLFAVPSLFDASEGEISAIHRAEPSAIEDHYEHEEGAGREWSTPPSLSKIGGGGLRKDGTETTSYSECTTASSSFEVEDSLALEVGLTAHEYLEECFYTEVSVLDREKFDAIPELVKSDFTTTRHLGNGCFSDVFEVVCKDGIHSQRKQVVSPARQPKGRRRGRSKSMEVAGTSCSGLQKGTYAMKCLRPQIRSDAVQFTIGAEDLVHETAILANLDHRHIIRLHGRAHGSLADAFVLNDGYFVILDKLNETLRERIVTWERNKTPAFRRPAAGPIGVARAVADAMSYLHSKGIVFRDLKPDNVGFDAAGTLKLFDFGFAAGLPEKDEANPAGFLFDRCGTLRYMAPEVGLSLGYGLKADVYSFAILLWEVCALSMPFASVASVGEFERAVFMGGDRPAIDDQWPTATRELIRGCWSAIPSTRPTMLNVKSSLSAMTDKYQMRSDHPGEIQRCATAGY